MKVIKKKKLNKQNLKERKRTQTGETKEIRLEKEIINSIRGEKERKDEDN